MLSGKKIFVFDNQESLWVLQEIFEANKMEVRTSSSVNQLVHEIVEFSPDLLLINIQLDTYDGRTLCYHLQQVPQIKGTPIIMMSETDDISMIDGVACKADLVIRKPFVVKVVLEKMGLLMKKNERKFE